MSITASTVIILIECVLLLYFIAINVFYLGSNIVSLIYLPRFMKTRDPDHLRHVYSKFEPPISVLAPAFNEATTIEASLRSLLQFRYSQYEVVVVNDGSSDDTMRVLIEKFALVPFPEAYRVRVPTEPVRAVYQSTVYPHLRVVDKENGGKGDALNAALNAARYPLVLTVDADSIYLPDTLGHMAQPFLEDPRTVGSGGTIRILNGCRVAAKDGTLAYTGLPRNLLARLQVLEYLRGFSFGRIAWSPLNAVMIVSGALGLWNKEAIFATGGFRTDTSCEDLELTVRLHHHFRREGTPYRIAFTPYPVCWTEVPETLKALKNQRIRWQRHVAESIAIHRGLLFKRRGGSAGWLGLPCLITFEYLSPVMEVGGFLFTGVAYALGFLSLEALLAFFVLTCGFGFLWSVTGLLLDGMYFRAYGLQGLLRLFLTAVVENLGYRQLHALWKLQGMVRSLKGKASGKFETPRNAASWQRVAR